MRMRIILICNDYHYHRGGVMNISRRSFIFGSVAASVFISLWDINPSKAEVKVGESAEDKKLIISTAFYGEDFCACIKKDNIIGCQFHPEKSHDAGLNIFSEFIRI